MVRRRKSDAVHRQAEALALAQAGAGGQDDQLLVAIGHGVDEGLDFLDRWRLDLVATLAGESYPRGRAAREQAVVDGGVEDGREDPIDDCHRRGREHVCARTDPGLQFAGADAGDWAVAEEREDMVPEVGVGPHDRRRPVELALLPGGRVLGERRLAGGGIDVGAVEQLALDAGEEAFGVGLAVEMAGPLWAAGPFPVAGAPTAVGALVHAGHPHSVRSEKRRDGRNRREPAIEAQRPPGYRRGMTASGVTDPSRDPSFEISSAVPDVTTDAQVRRTLPGSAPVRERRDRNAEQLGDVRSVQQFHYLYEAVDGDEISR